MKRVGVRELKAHLSEYLARVKSGEEVLITEHGRTIAKLTPCSPAEVEDERLRELERRGIIRMGKGIPPEFWELPRVEDPEGRLLKALLEERESGW
jgi:prevent-host-death family protein